MVKIKKRVISREELQKYDRKRVFDSTPTIEQWLFYWLDAYILQSCSNSTYANFKSYCCSHIIPVLGDYLLTELDYRHFQYYVDMKLKHGRLDHKGGLSVRTVKEHIQVLRSAFQKAVENAYLTQNPCTDIVFPKAVPQEVKTLTRKEQDALTSSISCKWQQNSDVTMLVALYAGLRIGEVAGLRLDDIDMINRRIRVDESLNRITVYHTNGKNTHPLMYGETKTKRVRFTPISDTLYGILDIYLKTMPKKVKRDIRNPLFINRNGKVMEPRNITYHFKKKLKALDICGVHFHCLRHTFATRALESGMNIKYCAAILGHANTSITENIYMHATSDQLQQEIKRMDISSIPFTYTHPQNLQY